MMNRESVDSNQKRLHFRRQFLLASQQLDELGDWEYREVGNLFLYVHPDLEITEIEKGGILILLLGSIFDPANPDRSNSDIISAILPKLKNFDDLKIEIKPFVGRYALIYKDERKFIILNDPLALREIYYCTQQNRIICGSQPNLIAKYSNPLITPSKDEEFQDFFKDNSKDSRWNPIRKWIGDETYYDGVKHVLPNHYLNIDELTSYRYWPNEEIKLIGLDEAITRICNFLQGGLRAVSNRHKVMMAITAGTDSRTILAASKDIKDKVYYFINDHSLGPKHQDVFIPSRLCKSLGIPFHVHKVPKEVDPRFREIFLENTFFASDRVLSSVYNVYYRNLSDRVNVLGIGEIGRTRYGNEPKNLCAYRMAYKLGHKKDAYAIKQGAKILSELVPVGKKFNVNVLTLLYWEHHLGNWGPTGNSESDIAIEEINIFDSHMLYEILLSVDPKYSDYYNPILFRELINRMWPELLKWPINPPQKNKDKVKSYLQRMGIYKILKECKYQINYVSYLLHKS